MKYHRDGTLPTDRSIFVFGSNLRGRHGRGAAHVALCGYGAIEGVGVGPQGQSYAIPTKDQNMQVLELAIVRKYVQQFIQYAVLFSNHDLRMIDEYYDYRTFFITAVGCGLAGYKPEYIAPMFRAAPANCSLPDIWKPYLE